MPNTMYGKNATKILLPLLTTIAATNPQTFTHTNAANKKITSHNSFYECRER